MEDERTLTVNERIDMLNLKLDVILKDIHVPPFFLPLHVLDSAFFNSVNSTDLKSSSFLAISDIS